MAERETPLGGVPVYELMPETDLRRILDASFQLLREVGVAFEPDPRVLDRFSDAGCEISADHTVRFETDLVEECLETTAKSARRLEHARIVALTIVDDINAVSVVAMRSALTGPTTAANPEPCVSEARNQATRSSRSAAASNSADVRMRVRASLAPSRQPPNPPAKAAIADPEGAIVPTSTLQAKPWITARATSAAALAIPTRADVLDALMPPSGG